MRIQDIKGTHKIRDFKICEIWLESDKTQREIADLVNLSERHIGRIVYKNRNVLKSEKEWEKAKRKHWLKVQIKKRGDSKKDAADLVEQLRREEEGDKAIVDQSTKYNIQIIRYGKDRRTDPSPAIQRADSQMAA